MSDNETLWYIDGIENVSLRNLTIISSENTTKNQNWSFSVRVFDGTNFSSFVTSENLTIDNALQIFNPVLGVESAELNSLFFYDINFIDLDSDNITFFDNSSLFNITNEGIINFTPTSIGNITINITMSQNPNVSDALIIEVKDTSPPVITSISTSSSGTTTVTVTLSATTDETAICRFETTDLNFTNMTQITTTNSTSHSNSIDYTSDTSGTYYVRCNDTANNVMNFSNSTAFDANVVEPSSGGGSSGGGGGGGGSGWSCRYRVECTEWSLCQNSKQTRSCKDVKVVPFYSDTKCEYLLKQETERVCTVPVLEEEIETIEEEKVEEEKAVDSSGNAITAAVTGVFENTKNNSWYLIAIVVIIVLGFFYSKYFKKPPADLSEENKQLNEMQEYSEYLKEK